MIKVIRCGFCGLKGLSVEHLNDFPFTEDYGVCEDCDEFLVILDAVYDTIETEISEKDVIDFVSIPEIRMLVDFGFISQNNTHIAAYKKTIALLLEYSMDNRKLIREIEITRKVSSSKSLGEILAPFIFLGLVDVDYDKERSFDRIIKIKEKLMKFSKVILIDSDPTQANLTDQLLKRTSLCLLGYILLGIMKMHANTDKFPSSFKLRSLWSTFSYIWPTAWSSQAYFDEDDFETYVKRRGVTSSSVGKLLQSFRQLNPNQINTLFDAIDTSSGHRKYIFNKSFLNTIYLIRERFERERDERERD